MDIRGFYDFIIFLNRCNTLTLQSYSMCFLEWYKYYLSSLDVDIIQNKEIQMTSFFSERKKHKTLS